MSTFTSGQALVPAEPRLSILARRLTHAGHVPRAGRFDSSAPIRILLINGGACLDGSCGDDVGAMVHSDSFGPLTRHAGYHEGESDAAAPDYAQKARNAVLAVHMAATYLRAGHLTGVKPSRPA